MRRKNIYIPKRTIGETFRGFFRSIRHRLIRVLAGDDMILHNAYIKGQSLNLYTFGLPEQSIGPIYSGKGALISNSWFVDSHCGISI